MSSLNRTEIPFIELPSVDSTNNYAMGLVHEGMAQHGMAVFTHEQTKGKGQRSKQWLSQRDMNIALSIIVEPRALILTDMFLLSMAIAAAVQRFFNNYTGGETKIKWPNDIYWRDRKAGGILIENIIKGKEWKFAIVGIGLNINQTSFDPSLSRAVSLKQITGKDFSPLLLARELREEVLKETDNILTNPDEIIRHYKTNLYKLNETVRFKKGNRIFEARVKDVSADGRLVVMHSIEEAFAVGEIEWMI